MAYYLKINACNTADDQESEVVIDYELLSKSSKTRRKKRVYKDPSWSLCYFRQDQN